MKNRTDLVNLGDVVLYQSSIISKILDLIYYMFLNYIIDGGTFVWSGMASIYRPIGETI